MDLAASVARVKLLGATASNPAVTDAEVTDIVESWAMADVDGNAPSDTAWAPTYDVNGATAEVWRIKAGRVASDFNFSADDASYSKGDVLAHCLDMEAKYTAMVGSATGVGVSNAGTITVGSSALGWPDQDLLADRLLP